MSAMPAPGSQLDRPPTSGLSEVVGMILDKGLVIDAFVRVSLIGIEVLTVEAKVVVASIDTYLRYAEAMAALEVARAAPVVAPQAATEIVQSVAQGVTRGALDAVQHSLDGVTQDVGAVTGNLPLVGEIREVRR